MRGGGEKMSRGGFSTPPVNQGVCLKGLSPRPHSVRIFTKSSAQVDIRNFCCYFKRRSSYFCCNMPHVRTATSSVSNRTIGYTYHLNLIRNIRKLQLQLAWPQVETDYCTSIWWFSAASLMGLLPYLSMTSLAPCRSSQRTTSTCPRLAAKCKGVAPSPSRRFGSTPWSWIYDKHK